MKFSISLASRILNKRPKFDGENCIGYLTESGEAWVLPDIMGYSRMGGEYIKLGSDPNHVGNLFWLDATNNIVNTIHIRDKIKITF